MFRLETDDAFGLGIEQPYAGIALTAEQVKLIEGREIVIYKCDGKSIFEVKNDNKQTISYVMFIVFK